MVALVHQALTATRPEAFTRAAPRSALRSLAACAFLTAATLALPACDDKSSADTARVKIGGENFTLELAATDEKRFRGLSERTHIERDGGMLFVFPDSKVRVQGFVMRDCPIGIDIVYCDGAGRVLSAYEMAPEAPRDPAKGEGTPSDPNNKAYNERLKQYSSRYPAQFVIELAAGTNKRTGVKEGDLISMDVVDLKKRAR